MITKELKKKNYIRFLQLEYYDAKSHYFLVLVFLLEIELIKIFVSSEDKQLREIKYQWLIEELDHNHSKYFITNALQNYKKKFSREIIDYINAFKEIENNEKRAFEIETFKKITQKLNALIHITKLPIKFSSNFLFCYFYFLYNVRDKSFIKKKILDKHFKKYINNEIDDLEITFIRIFRKKYKFEINKLSFFYLLLKRKLFKS